MLNRAGTRQEISKGHDAVRRRGELRVSVLHHGQNLIGTYLGLQAARKTVGGTPRVLGNEVAGLIESREEGLDCLRIGVGETLRREHDIERDIAEEFYRIDDGVNAWILQFQRGIGRGSEMRINLGLA